jgi:DNA-binding LacI/PurR family transcriptional regulator
LRNFGERLEGCGERPQKRYEREHGVNGQHGVQSVKSYKSLCQERGVDGVIIMGMRLDDPYLKEILSSHIPCVLIDIPLKNKKIGFVTSDNIAGAHRMTRYMLEQGHRTIALMNGHIQADVSLKRLEGYRQALSETGVPFDDGLVLDGGFTDERAREATYQLMAQRPDVTAIFCASDLMALGTLSALRSLGLDVPGDVSVAGFDNINVSAYCSPSLTTVNQNKYELGYQATQMLIDMLEGRQVAKEVKLTTELVLRESVGPPRKR